MTLCPRLLRIVASEINNFTYTRGKTFIACISETKAHWMKRRNRCLFIFYLLAIDPIFGEIPDPSLTELSLSVGTVCTICFNYQ